MDVPSWNYIWQLVPDTHNLLSFNPEALQMADPAAASGWLPPLQPCSSQRFKGT